jgi:hypothetical protein
MDSRKKFSTFNAKVEIDDHILRLAMQLIPYKAVLTLINSTGKGKKVKLSLYFN